MSLHHQQDIVAEIYASGYYTNHGPMARRLEETLQQYFGVEHAVVVGNESLALVMALSGLGLKGPVGVAQPCPEFVLSAVTWAGLAPTTYAGPVPSDGLAARLLYLDPNYPTSPSDLREATGLKTVVYHPGPPTPRTVVASPRGNDLIVVTSIADTAEAPSAACAAILTADATLAEKFRNIRSSYGARKIVEVTATSNGRVSEFQAGLALLLLQKLSDAESPGRGITG